jgi:hypothetical protein
MQRAGAVVAAAIIAALFSAAAAQAGGNVDARVETVATVIVGNVVTDFEIDLYNCPAGEPMEVVYWEAQQPSRPADSGTSVGTQPYGVSTGDNVQYLVVTTEGNFVPGESWVGDGLVACGAVLIPVTGQGQTKALTGV